MKKPDYLNMTEEELTSGKEGTAVVKKLLFPILMLLIILFLILDFFSPKHEEVYPNVLDEQPNLVE